MDFYSTFFCLPQVHPTLPHPNSTSTTTTAATGSTTTTTTTNASSIIPNHQFSPSTPSDGSSASPISPRLQPASLPLVSRIPSQIATGQSPVAPALSPRSSPSSDIPTTISHLSARPAPLPAPETVQAACDELMSQHHCLVVATHALRPSTYGFHLSGSFPQVMAARGRLLREQPFEVESVVAVERNDVLEGGTNVRPLMKLRLDEIASASHAHLSIVGNGGAGGGVDVVVRGEPEAVEEARVRLLVLLDQLSGLHSEVCEIDYKLHHIIAGRKRSVIQSIQEETATNIYFPSVLSGGGVLGAPRLMMASKQNMIFITGEYFGVQRAREMLFQVSIHKSKCIISRDTAMLPRKLDWLLMEKLPQLQEIMYDNGTFINFPPVGSQISVLSVYGDHRVHIERTIRSLMRLACDFYIANVWLLPNSLQDVYKNGSQPALINQSEIQADGNRIAIESGAEVVFKSTNSFEVYGTEQCVKQAVERILKLEMVKNCQVEIRFQVELACEHRDFISGKKNGKLNKIMKTSSVKIKFESFNDYNFMIDVSGNSMTALVGLTLLEEELPAEISFHIPEGYHKRIIGVGGKNIQRIMKKYGVYVKFSNAEEFAKLGGYQDNHDNVVARTPAKNAINLDNLKQSVMELVHPKDKDFVTEQMLIDRNNHRTILGEKSIFIHDIESKTNTCFYFPPTESGSNVIGIFGPRSQIAIARQMIMTHIGLESDFRLVGTSELIKLVRSEEFEERIIKKCKRNWNVAVLVINGGAEGEDMTIKFGLSRANADNLKHARDTLEALLMEKKINFQPERSFNAHHRRSTVTSIASSIDRPTSVGTYAPTTPTESLGFSVKHHASEKDLQGLFDRSSSVYPQSGLSSSVNSSYVYHPGMSLNRFYNPFVGATAHVGAGGTTGGTNEFHSIPRQLIKNNYNSGLIGAGVNIMANTIGTGLNLENSSLPSLVNRKMVLSPRAQSLDLGKSTAGSQLIHNSPNALLSSAGRSSMSSYPSSGSAVNSALLSHRHQFSQGGIGQHPSSFINGFGGLNIGL